MLDFPTGHPGHPPLRSPEALLGWLARGGWRLLLPGTLLTVVRSLCGAAVPILLGVALDAGLDGVTHQLLWVCGGLLALGLLEATTDALSHVGETGGWMHGAVTNSRLVGHHVTRTGQAIGAELPTGEVVSTVASDTYHFGNVLELIPHFVASIVVYIAVAVYMLGQSITLGLVIVLGLPVVALILATVIKPLHTRQRAQREATGYLTTLASDTVAGLRVLRGIGGEAAFTERYRHQSQRVRQAGVRVADISSLLAGLQLLLPGLFVAGIVWLGARLAVSGEISPGQLVTFYGFTAFLGQPLQWATNFVNFLTRARVAARKVIAVLDVKPDAGSIAASEEADHHPPDPPSGVARAISDETSGFQARPGSLTAVVTPEPTDMEALAVRLGRFDDSLAAGVHLDGRELRDMPLAQVRSDIVVAPATPELFTGTLRSELQARGQAEMSDAQLYEALHVADAADVLDSLPEGLAGSISEKGRSLSGGQRQRVALARALLTDADVLVLLEPTSAVDAHTESRIAKRLADYRRGRTTIVMTSSPLVLEHVDEAVLLHDGNVDVRGPHHELLARASDGDDAAAAYRRAVNRATAQDDEQMAGQEAGSCSSR